jgi:hypothetical protein
MEVAWRTVRVARRLVDILLIRIEKGIDGGDDVPCLLRDRKMPSDKRKRARSADSPTYVGESTGGGHRSSVDWTRGTSRSLTAHGIARVTLTGWIAFCVKVGLLGVR